MFIIKNLLFITIIFFFISCSKSTEQSTNIYENHIYLNKSSQLKVSLFYNNKLLHTTESSLYDEHKGSLFSVSLPLSIKDTEILILKIDDINTTINLMAKDLRSESLSITELSFLQEHFDEENNSTLSSFILNGSVDGDEDIDREDILYLSPRQKQYLLQVNLFESLQVNSVYSTIVNDTNLSELLNMDYDNDSISRFNEILNGSSDFNIDSDDDGLLDSEELLLGTSLYREDSDFDGIDDKNETRMGTSPISQDSDNDYCNDAVEVYLGTNPLDADENMNGILDGIENDPLSFLQWHLKSNGDSVSNTNNVATIVGNDLNIFKANSKVKTYLSKPKIQVIDTGVEAIHEDLEIDMNLSSNSINGSNNPTHTEGISSIDKSDALRVGHGTAVAGILAAISQNGIGVRGVVPGAVIVGSNWLEDGQTYKLEDLWYYSDAAKSCPISNNSWGGYYINDDTFEQIMEMACSSLRDGKGRMFVVPSGNDREDFGNANLSTLANNPYVFTVAALNYENTHASYSNAGSNVLVSAYGGEKYFDSPTITTTLLMGKSYYYSELGGVKGALTHDSDLNRNYTLAMNGTSAATPMVSGVIALTLDACPNLSWREMKYLMAKTSQRVYISNE